MSVVEDQREGILWLMKRAFSLQRRNVERAMRVHGVTAAQAGVLSQLLLYPGLSSSDIARNLVITPQAATIAVVGLEGKGMIERTTDPNHGRIRRCSLTDEGQRVAEACYPAAREVEDKLLGLFTDEQREKFAEYLRLFLGEIPAEEPPRPA
ncbi:MAG TPA: MarR family transcriptional regulator, partial [Gaiellaceae bacterium]|nr:MarR family transcriptional regulator [Gaiellaceae bacterium]